jgi:hypothetical protein
MPLVLAGARNGRLSKAPETKGLQKIAAFTVPF